LKIKFEVVSINLQCSNNKTRLFVLKDMTSYYN